MTALSLAAPVQILMSAMGLGIAVGLNAVISRALGERNRKRVEETASAALVLAIYVNSVLMAITPTIFTPSILLSMKALSAVVKSLCQCFSVPQTAGIRHVSVFPAVLPCFDGGRHNAGPSLSISVYQARHAPSQHCGPSRAVRQAVSVEVLDKKADIKIFRALLSYILPLVGFVDILFYALIGLLLILLKWSLKSCTRFH